MRQRETLFLLFSLLIFTFHAAAQNQLLTIKWPGTPHREPVNVYAGTTRVKLTGLIAGKSYQVIAVGAYPEQPATFRLRMAAPALEAAAQQQSAPGRPQLRRFRAPAGIVELLLEATASGNQEIPAYLSVGCLDCAEAGAWTENFAEAVGSKLVVTEGNTANDLVTNVLIGGNCFDVKNITAKGAASSRGTFSSGQSSINIADGVVLCTAPTSVLPGPNNLTNTNGGFGDNSANDVNLATLTNGGDQYDVSVIEFDFTPTANNVKFDFVFGSEEYCEFVNSQYNDAFGFFISGPGISGVKNLALIPGTSNPVSINTVNHLKNKNYYRNNNSYGDCFLQPVYNMNDIQLDGFTTVLTATANVTPCATYHIKLAIADIADANYTSAVFLRANSFDAGGDVKANVVYPSTPAYSVEGCTSGYIKFYRGSGDINQPLQVTYMLAGNSTATPGLDYTPLPTSILIPAGQNEVLVPVNVIDDQLTEGDETIHLILDNPCSCQQQDVNFVIRDKVPLSLSLPSQSNCTNTPITLTPVLNGGGLPPYQYLWSNGQTNSSIQVTAPGSSAYIVTVTDMCGLSATATATATIDQTPAAQLSGPAFVCPGSTGNLTINFLSGNGPWIVGLNANGVTQTQNVATNPATIPISGPGVYTLTSVTTPYGCNGLAGGSVSVQNVAINLNLAPTPPQCFGDLGAIQGNVTTNNAPLTYAWNTGGSGAQLQGLPAGTYTLTVTTALGCTSSASAMFTAPAALTALATASNTIDCYKPESTVSVAATGGTTGYQYAWSSGAQTASGVVNAGGTYVVTVTDAHLCTATTSVTVAQNTTPPVAVATATGELTCNTPEVALSSAGSSSGGGFVYQWSTQDGHLMSGQDGPSPEVDMPGTYTLVIQNTQNGCTALASALVSENTNYPTDLATQITLPSCEHKSGAIQIKSVKGGVGPYVYSLDGGDTYIANPAFGGLPPGAYTLIVQDANGCEFSKPIELPEPVKPDVSIDPEIALDYGASGTLHAQLNISLSEVDTIIWAPQQGLTPGISPDIVLARPFRTTQYTVTVIAKNGCEDRATLIIRVGDPNIYAPNAIRPGKGDGVNDMFTLFFRDYAVNRIKHLQVFDRWGNLVFSRDNILPNDDRSGGWDGRYKGKTMEPGVFTWWAEVELASGESIYLQGDVSIVE